MSGAYTYPGVYIQELPSPVHTIIGVPTAITALVGAAARGPVNEPTDIGSVADYETIFGGDGTLPLDLAVNLFFQNGGGNAIIVRVGPAQAIPVASAALPGSFGALDLSKNPGLQAASPGAWGDSLTGTVDQTNLSPTDAKTLYNLTLTDTSNSTTERYMRVSADPTSPRSLSRMVAASSLVAIAPAAPPPVSATSAGGTPAAGATPAATTPVATTTTAGAAPATGASTAAGGAAPAPAAPPAPINFTFAGGDGGNQSPKNSDLPGDQVAQTGIYALLKHDTFFNLLVLTPLEGDDVPATVLSAAADFAYDHRAILIVDAPSGWSSVTAAANGRDADLFEAFGTNQKTNAAVYFPRITLTAPDGTPVPDVGPAALIAGLYAATDTSRGVWKAPAGIGVQLSGIAGLELRMSDFDNGRLNPVAVNCLRTLPVIGNVVWGARTMAGDDVTGSQWKYVPVRRLALYIEESLYRGTQWVVFEPNDEPLWAQVRLNIGSFMNTLFRQGAFQGATATDAYFVKCDASTNPQADIDAGILNVIVGFAPLKPAEFVVIKIQQISPGLTT